MKILTIPRCDDDMDTGISDLCKCEILEAVGVEKMYILTAMIPLSNVVEAEPPRERETMDGVTEASVKGFDTSMHQEIERDARTNGVDNPFQAGEDIGNVTRTGVVEHLDSDEVDGLR